MMVTSIAIELGCHTVTSAATEPLVVSRKSLRWITKSLLWLTVLPSNMHSFSYFSWHVRSRSSININSMESTRKKKIGYCVVSSERASSNNSISSKYRTRLSSEDEARCLRMAEEYRRILSIKEKSSSIELDKEHWASLADVKDATEIDSIIAEGVEARHKLMEHNMGLVHYVVSKHFYSSAIGYDDLIQEGVLGLAVALEKYDCSIATNSTFGTYAYYWIRASVSRAIASHGAKDLIRIPEHVSLAITKLQKACQRLGLDCDLTDEASVRTSTLLRDPSREKALAMEAGLTVRQLKEALLVANRRKMGGYVELEPWLKSTLTAVEEHDQLNKGKEFWTQAFGKFLRPKELEALGLRYGLWPISGDSSTSYTNPTVTMHPKPFRDYEAEAEEVLFGASSILLTSDQQQQLQGKPKTVKQEKNDIYMVKKGKWGEAMSFREIAKTMQISTEYGRRLCSSAVDKLREAAQNGQLKPELIFL